MKGIGHGISPKSRPPCLAPRIGHQARFGNVEGTLRRIELGSTRNRCRRIRVTNESFDRTKIQIGRFALARQAVSKRNQGYLSVT